MISKYPFTDRSAQRCFKSNTPNAVCWLSALIVACIWFYFHHLRTHKELIKGTVPPRCSMFAFCLFCFGYTACSLREIMSHLVITFLFLVRLEVFGPCCVHISFEPHQSLFGSGPRPIFFAVSVRLFGAHQDSDGSVHTYSIDPH